MRDKLNLTLQARRTPEDFCRSILKRPNLNSFPQVRKWAHQSASFIKKWAARVCCYKNLKLLQLVNSAVMLTVWSELDRIWQAWQISPVWLTVYLHCFLLAPLVVKKYDWPVHNVTDRKFVQSLFKFFSEGACPFQTLSVSSFPDEHKKYISCICEKSLLVCQVRFNEQA